VCKPYLSEFTVWEKMLLILIAVNAWKTLLQVVHVLDLWECVRMYWLSSEMDFFYCKSCVLLFPLPTLVFLTILSSTCVQTDSHDDVQSFCITLHNIVYFRVWSCNVNVLTHNVRRFQHYSCVNMYLLNCCDWMSQ